MRALYQRPRSLCLRLSLSALALALAGSSGARAQTCLSAGDLDPATKNALLTTAQTYSDAVARGDSATLRQNAIASLAADFSGIEAAIHDNQGRFSGARAVPRAPFLLEAQGTTNLERAEFLCGVFGANGQTADSAVFVIPNLPPGNYGVVTQDVNTAKGPYTISYILQQQAGAWKLGGLYIKSSQAGGHDGNWFADRARAFKAKGQHHNAWFYYLEARELLVPLSFMSTAVTDKLYDEAQTVKPADLPPLDLAANGKTFKLTAMFPLAVANDFDLVVKYDSASVANAAQTYQDNLAVIKALLTKYPELREAFDGVIARAVEPSGRDYGSMLPMKDVK